MTYEEIQKLGFLARIEVSKDMAEVFAKDMENILKFVSQIESVDVDGVETSHRFKNMMREDSNPYEPGIFTQDILAEAPDTQDGFIKVKKIL